jgi:predicted PurR-regulated permease PerM
MLSVIIGCILYFAVGIIFISILFVPFGFGLSAFLLNKISNKSTNNINQKLQLQPTPIRKLQPQSNSILEDDLSIRLNKVKEMYDNKIINAVEYKAMRKKILADHI